MITEVRTPSRDRRAGRGRPKLILAAAFLVVVVGAVFGAGVLGALKLGGLTDPDSESDRAQAVLADRFPQADSNLVVLVEKPGGSVDDEDARQAGLDVTR